MCVCVCVCWSQKSQRCSPTDSLGSLCAFLLLAWRQAPHTAALPADLFAPLVVVPLELMFVISECCQDEELDLEDDFDPDCVGVNKLKAHKRKGKGKLTSSW